MSRGRWLWVITAIWAAVNVAADLVLGVSSPGLIVAIGFLGCAGLIHASKWLGATLLQRPFSYYEDLEVAAAPTEQGRHDDR